MQACTVGMGPCLAGIRRRHQAAAMPAHATPGRLSGCYVISLRPVGGHGPVRRAAAAQGAHVLALSPWRIQARDDAHVRADLDAALAAARVVFTSPAAVPAAAALRPLQPRP